MVAYDLVGEVLVVCPSCGGMARVVVPPGAVPPKGHGRLFTPRRLVCAACGHTAEHDAERARIGDATDPWFGAALWLQDRVAGHVLWAWNAEHVDLIEAYVGATLRTRPHRPRPAPASLLERLPPWVKAAGNREEVLAALTRMRDRLA